jgi:hypothetical protein
MGEHFDGLKEYGSAKYYYAQVLKNYPDSQLATNARQRMTEIGGLPERPSSFLDPALDYLPENAERKAIAQVPMIEKPTTQTPLPGEGETRVAGATSDDTAPAEPIRR